MATIKAQNNRRNAANTGWDVIHHETSADIVLMDDGQTTLSSRLKFQTAAGTATAITLTGVELVNGFQLTFVVLSSNIGAATTINSKPLYKPGTTIAPKLVAGKAATVWYNLAGGCFFIKASAEGTAVAGDVLAGNTFSNDDDTGLVGTMVDRGTFNLGLGVPVPAGRYTGGTTANGKRWVSGTFNGWFDVPGSHKYITGLPFKPKVIMVDYTADGYKKLSGNYCMSNNVYERFGQLYVYEPTLSGETYTVDIYNTGTSANNLTWVVYE